MAIRLSKLMAYVTLGEASKMARLEVRTAI